MRYNQKEAVLAALKENAQLVSVLGKVKDGSGNKTDIPSIFSGHPPSWNCLPALSFEERSGNKDSHFADDACIQRRYSINIDVWNEGSTTEVFQVMDSIMRGLGYICEFEADINEPGLNRRTARYIIYREED